MEDQKVNVEQTYRTLVIIWAALFMSQLLFLVLVYFVKPKIFKLDLSTPVLDKENAVFVIALAAVALANFVLSFVIKKKFLAQAVKEQKIELVQTAMIVGCALCESISLFGLLLVFLFSYQYFFLFFGLAILGFIFHFPRRGDLIDASFKSKIT